MEETIDLKEYFFIIKRRLWIIVLSAVICGIISSIINIFILSPVYEATTTLIVNKEVGNEQIGDEQTGDEQVEMNTSDDLDFVQQLALTYGEIIKSKTVITSTIDELNLDLTYEDISKNISVTNVTDTQIIKISVKNNDPHLAAEICNTIPRIFANEAQRVVKASSIEIIDEADIPKKPIKPNKVMNIAIATTLGVMISIFIILLQETFNTKVKSRKDIEDKLCIPVFGEVPKY